MLCRQQLEGSSSSGRLVIYPTTGLDDRPAKSERTHSGKYFGRSGRRGANKHAGCTRKSSAGLRGNKAGIFSSESMADLVMGLVRVVGSVGHVGIMLGDA